MPRTRTAALSLLAAALLAGCSQGPDAFEENFPGDDPVTDVRFVPRLPEVPSELDDAPLLPTRDPEPPVASQDDAGRGGNSGADDDVNSEGGGSGTAGDTG